MSRPGGTVEVRKIVRDPVELAEIVLQADRLKFEEAVLKLWADHVRRVRLEVERLWLDVPGEP